MESQKLVLQQLKTFIEESECRLNSILNKLNWNKESMQISDCNIFTSESANKPIPFKPAADEFPQSFQSTESPCTIKLDNIKQAEAILEEVYQNPSFNLGVPLEEIEYRKPPSNLEDLQVNFSREERLALHHHVLKKTTGPPEVPDIKIRFKWNEHAEEKPATLAEIAALERDGRRRNPKHRVSRNPLTYREELRQLINVQTEALAQHLHKKYSNEAKSGSCSKVKSKHRRSSHSDFGDEESSHKRKKRHRSRSRTKERYRERSSSNERQRRKSQKKHKKKYR